MDGLTAAVQAAASGSGVVTPELLGTIVRSRRDRAQRRQRARRARHADRPRAAGPGADRRRASDPRGRAQQLCYSERTVKNVLHDVVTKLNARSRSQAVAFAVREGLI